MKFKSKRMKIKPKKSKALFTKTAKKVHPRNHPTIHRGGERL